MTSGFGVSGVVTRARAIRASLPRTSTPRRIPMAAPVAGREGPLPARSARRQPAGGGPCAPPMPASVRAACCRSTITRSSCPGRPRSCTRATAWSSRWASSCSGWRARSMGTGTVQIWPGTPVAEALIDGQAVRGVRLLDQGVDKQGRPGRRLHAGHGHPRRAHGGRRRPGRSGRAAARRGASACPRGNTRRDWAVGMKFVVDLPGGHHADSPARCCTPSAFPSRRSSGSCTSTPTASRRWASSCRPGSTSRCAPPTATCSTGCCTRISGATSRAAGSARGAPRRSASPAAAASRTWPATATPASARAPARPTSSPAPGWTRPGPPACSSPRACSSC